MTETAQFEKVESMADPIVQVSQVSVSAAKPQQSAPMDDHVDVTETKHTSKKHEIQDSMLNKDTVKVQETSRTVQEPNGIEQKDRPDNQTERVQTTTETEYETVEGGKKKHVKSSLTEMKEVSHRVHRTLYNDSPDSTSANVSEFSEIPRTRPGIPVKTSSDSGQKLPRTPVMPTIRVSSARPVFVERTIDTGRSATEQRSKTLPSGMLGFVPVQLHEEVKRSYERELAELKNIQPSVSNTELKTESKEEMTRQILQLETDLRDSKSMSEVLSDEIKTSRKRLQYMLNKTVQLEGTVRDLRDKLNEYKSRNKQLLRDTQERDTLLDRLREANTQVKRMERYVEKVEDERSMLVKDYEILRQSHNRKEHQLQGYTTERAELLRRLDILEYEKQQLELQLMDHRRKDRSSTYRSSTYSPRKSHSHKSASRASGTPWAGRTSSLPYGELPSDLQVDINPASEVGAPAASTGKTNGTINAESRREPGWSVDIGANRTETGDDETLRESLVAPENTESPSVNVDTLAVDPSSQAVDETSPADTVRGQSSPQRTHTDGAGEDETGRASGSRPASPDLRGDNRRHEKPPRLPIERDDHILSPTDSQYEEPIVPYVHSSTRIAQSYDDSRYASSKNYHVKRRTIRRAGDYHTSRSVDVRGDAYARNSRYRRPTSAYGYVSSRYTTRDIEVFPSPLPPRSTTSLGRSAFVEHVRSPDREFSRMHRSPMRRANPSYNPYATMSPDPFRYEPIKSRPEVSQLEAQLESLRREKRRLERQYNATQTASSLTDNLRRREELSDRIVQLGMDIRHLQMRINSLH